MTIQDGKIVPAPPTSSVALIKATKAIESCLSVDALDIIDKQVANSVKLTDEDKAALLPLMEKKYAELDKPKESTNSSKTPPVLESNVLLDD
jgi:hypothetical protein